MKAVTKYIIESTYKILVITCIECLRDSNIGGYGILFGSFSKLNESTIHVRTMKTIMEIL